MNTQAVKNNQINNFISKNWFRLLIIGAGIYIVFQKDLSFTVNFNAPFQQEKAKPEKPVASTEEKEQYTLEAKQLAASSKGGLEKFELPLFSTKGKEPDWSTKLKNVDKEVSMSYLKRFAHVAISERKKYGVPASITLANALLHSTAGKNDAARDLNNHFQLKDRNGKLLQFENAWASFRAHSEFITSKDFTELRKLSSKDYQAWAKGLEEAGFGNSRNLRNSLLQIIDDFQLYELDNK